MKAAVSVNDELDKQKLENLAVTLKAAYETAISNRGSALQLAKQLKHYANPYAGYSSRDDFNNWLATSCPSPLKQSLENINIKNEQEYLAAQILTDQYANKLIGEFNLQKELAIKLPVVAEAIPISEVDTWWQNKSEDERRQIKQACARVPAETRQQVIVYLPEDRRYYYEDNILWYYLFCTHHADIYYHHHRFYCSAEPFSLVLVDLIRINLYMAEGAARGIYLGGRLAANAAVEIGHGAGNFLATPIKVEANGGSDGAPLYLVILAILAALAAFAAACAAVVYTAIKISKSFLNMINLKKPIKSIFRFLGAAGGCYLGYKYGMLAGAVIGSLIPGVGTAIGAIVGCILGALIGSATGIFIFKQISRFTTYCISSLSLKLDIKKGKGINVELDNRNFSSTNPRKYYLSPNYQLTGDIEERFPKDSYILDLNSLLTALKFIKQEKSKLGFFDFAERKKYNQLIKDIKAGRPPLDKEGYLKIDLAHKATYREFKIVLPFVQAYPLSIFGGKESPIFIDDTSSSYTQRPFRNFPQPSAPYFPQPEIPSPSAPEMPVNNEGLTI